VIRTHVQLQSVSAVCGLLAGPVLFITTGAAVLAQPDEFSVPGAASLLAAVVWFAWITILAIRMHRLSRESGTLQTG
jgi:hypothetical protein